MSTRVAFRVDASLDIGTGHIMRCLTLADALAASGAECRFICREHPGNLIEQIRSKGYCVHALPSEADSPDAYDNAGPDHAAWLGCHWETDAAQTKAILIDEAPNWLVADHYALDVRWESALEGCYGKLMVIDDVADRLHACDLLLDQNLGREPEDYEALVPEHCQRLIGPRYALLRPEFAALREYSLQRRQTPELKRLLITMGGVDQPNATGKVLEALKSCALPSDCKITVVMGPAAPWLEPVRALASSMPWPTEVLVNVSNMAQIMANGDLAIGAAGSTSWERCCLGLPTLLITLAENQRAGAQALHQAGAARWLGEPEAIPHELAAALPMLLGGQLVAEMSQAARGLTEGRGAARVLQKMECLA
jgi:UDP-2,4-diacetamido-2,4,6-trideoxy-beta-L-altropyranose hydrolase